MHHRLQRRSPRRLSAALATAALLGTLAGCGGAQSTPEKKSGQTVVVLDQRAAAPRLTFGNVALLMTRRDVAENARSAGWKVSGEVPNDGTVAMIPPAGDPASQYGVRLEAGRVIQISIKYVAKDKSRVAMRHDYAKSKVQTDGSWAMTDALRTTLVVIAAEGASLVATHLGATKDKTGAAAMLRRYLGE